MEVLHRSWTIGEVSVSLQFSFHSLVLPALQSRCIVMRDNRVLMTYNIANFSYQEEEHLITFQQQLWGLCLAHKACSGLGCQVAHLQHNIHTFSCFDLHIPCRPGACVPLRGWSSLVSSPQRKCFLRQVQKMNFWIGPISRDQNIWFKLYINVWLMENGKTERSPVLDGSGPLHKWSISEQQWRVS